MRIVSMDETSDLFITCFYHGDVSSATATRPFKMRKKCRKPSVPAPKLESGKFALESAQRPIILRDSNYKLYNNLYITQCNYPTDGSGWMGGTPTAQEKPTESLNTHNQT